MKKHSRRLFFSFQSQDLNVSASSLNSLFNPAHLLCISLENKPTATDDESKSEQEMLPNSLSTILEMKRVWII